MLATASPISSGSAAAMPIGSVPRGASTVKWRRISEPTLTRTVPPPALSARTVAATVSSGRSDRSYPNHAQGRSGISTESRSPPGGTRLSHTSAVDRRHGPFGEMKESSAPSESHMIDISYRGRRAMMLPPMVARCRMRWVAICRQAAASPGSAVTTAG